MKRSKLTKLLKNKFRVVQVCKIKPITLGFSQVMPKRSLNSLGKAAHMNRSTFRDNLERARTDGLVTYETHGRGKAATNIQVTDQGVIFLCDMIRKHPSLRRESSGFNDLWFYNQQTKLPEKIDIRVQNWDIVHNGRLSKCKCPDHPNSKKDYEFLAGKGVIVRCSELQCNFKRFFENISGFIGNKQQTWQ